MYAHSMHPEGMMHMQRGGGQEVYEQPQPLLPPENLQQPQQNYNMTSNGEPNIENTIQNPSLQIQSPDKSKPRRPRGRPPLHMASGESGSPKRPKKKNKNVDTLPDDGTGIIQPKKSKKKKHHPIDGEVPANAIKEDPTSEVEEFQADLHEGPEELNFAEDDLPKLLGRIHSTIPSNDTSAFRTRVKKIDWNKVAFDDYTPERCQEAWLFIQKRQRQHRVLSELVEDAKDWIRKPLKPHVGKPKNHPDFPKRPLSSYMQYYVLRKDKMMADNPGTKTTEISRRIAQEYNEMSEEERAKYTSLAMKQKQEYEIEVEEFFTKHPDIPRTSDRAGDKKDCRVLKKAHTPFGLFVDDEAKKDNVTEKSVFRDQCKDKWKNMAEKNKMFWINWALELERQSQEQMGENAEYTPRQILTKEEKQLKERMDGKPVKPPNSAYSLFSRILLQGDELKDINTKDRMKAISLKWKDLPEEQKTYYRDQAHQLVEKYKHDYANYLESLPQDKRDIELKKPVPKRKVKVEEPPPPALKKNKKDEPDGEEKTLNPLIDVVIPKTWGDMADGERSMYMKYIQKIKDYFDTQHQTALEQNQASNGSDSESDSVSSE